MAKAGRPDGRWVSHSIAPAHCWSPTMSAMRVARHGRLRSVAHRDELTPELQRTAPTNGAVRFLQQLAAADYGCIVRGVG